jgi:hypothetical protein
LGKIGPLGDKKKGGSIGQRSKLQTIENSLKIVHKSSGVGLAGVGMGLGFKPTPAPSQGVHKFKKTFKMVEIY